MGVVCVGVVSSMFVVSMPLLVLFRFYGLIDFPVS